MCFDAYLTGGRVVRVALNYGGISLVNYYYIYYVLLYVYDSEFLFFLLRRNLISHGSLSVVVVGLCSFVLSFVC